VGKTELPQQDVLADGKAVAVAAATEPTAQPEALPEAVEPDSQSTLARLRTELRDAYRRADPFKPDAEIPRLWNAIHEIQARLGEPMATILIKVRRSKTGVPLVLYYDTPTEKRRELRLAPGAIEVVTPLVPASVTYLIHGPHPAGDGPMTDLKGGLAGANGGAPPPAPGLPFPPGVPPPRRSGPPSLSARRLDLKNRELVLEFEFSAVGGRWKHHLQLPVFPAN
jgi:hypothetical protein